VSGFFYFFELQYEYHLFSQDITSFWEKVAEKRQEIKVTDLIPVPSQPGKYFDKASTGTCTRPVKPNQSRRR
jgi:hypothetical protein